MICIIVIIINLIILISTEIL